MKIIIAGRTQTGKTYLARRIAELTGMKVLKTCTTRPKRFPDEDTYHFYTEDEYKAIPSDEKFTETTGLDGFARWTTKSDILEADIAILDIEGIAPVCRLWRVNGSEVLIIYVQTNEDLRRYIALKETSIAPEDYENRCTSEDEQFRRIETEMSKTHPFGSSMDTVWKNNMTESAMEHILTYVQRRIKDDVMDDNAGTRFEERDLFRAFDADRTDPLIWKTLCDVFRLNPECTASIALHIDRLGVNLTPKTTE